MITLKKFNRQDNHGLVGRQGLWPSARRMKRRRKRAGEDSPYEKRRRKCKKIFRKIGTTLFYIVVSGREREWELIEKGKERDVEGGEKFGRERRKSWSAQIGTQKVEPRARLNMTLPRKKKGLKKTAERLTEI